MRRFLIGVGLLAAASPAAADWQYTRWGMSLEQLKASGRPIGETDSANFSRPGSEVRAVASHDVGGIQTYAVFAFGGERLNRVLVVPTESANCAALLGLLRRQYGDPLGGSRSAAATGARWSDASGGNEVRYLSIGDTCSIEYEPLSQQGGSGL